MMHQCINGLLKSKPAYDKSCYLHFSRFNPVFPVAFKNAPIITLPEKGDILLQADINVHVLITRGAAVTLRCQGHPAAYETVPAGVYRLSLNYPFDLKSQLWTINSLFNYVYNVTLASSIKFELPYNSYMSPLLEMNLPHEQSNFTMFADEQEIDLQLTDLKPVEYPTAISWDFDWRYTFALACLVLMIVFGIWTCKRVGCCERFDARCARLGRRSMVTVDGSSSRRVDPPPEEIELVILPQPAFPTVDVQA